MIIGGAAAAIVIAAVIIATYPMAPPNKSIRSYSSGNFTAHVIEDNSNRLLVKLENKGPLLNDTGAFLVRQGFNNDCEPQGVIVSNFNVGTRAGQPFPAPDYIPDRSNITLDSASARIDTIPIGDSLRTEVYILKLKPDSIIASDIVEQITIRDANLTQIFDNCLQQTGKGYPVLLKVANPQPGSITYFTLEDNATGIKYETVLDVNNNAPKLNEIYWPPSRDGWLADNFTKQAGPAPAWKTEELPRQLVLTVATTDSTGQIHQSAYPIELAKTRTFSVDFPEQAKGKIVPPYPQFWQIVVDVK